MTKDTGPFRLANSWPRIAWSSLAAVVVISVVLGFVILSRYQQNGPTLGTWAAICRSLGITADTAPANEPQPTLRTPTLVAWTSGTMDRIRAGDAKDGEFIALSTPAPVRAPQSRPRCCGTRSQMRCAPRGLQSDTVPGRLARLGSDPWADIREVRQSLNSAVRRHVRI
jgi:hypothetical protein